MSAPDPFFKPIGEHVEGAPDAASQPHEEQKMVDEIESLCLQCEKMGMTRLLLTYIPYFKEVIVVSFFCEHCGHRNNEIQSAGQIQEKGCLYTIHCTDVPDLNRQVVKSEWCTVTIPELQITVPAKRGQLTTIEGVLSDTLRDLELDQPLRKHMEPETYAKIEELCNRLRVILGEEKGSETQEEAHGENDAAIKSHGAVGPVGSRNADENRTFPAFSVRLDDPSGNSFVEFMGSVEGRGVTDAKWSKRDYPRSKEQNEALGLAGPADEGERQMHTTSLKDIADASKPIENEEILFFPSTCSSCNSPLDCLMKKVNIPYFKDIIIMSTNCERCGYRDNEVKSGSAISPKGRKLTLTVNDSEDLSRDILKSETAGLSIPEIDLHLTPGTLGGRFTTLEGLLQQVYDELSEKVMSRGDSASGDKATFEGFLGKLKGVMSAETVPFTVVLDDALANSYIQNPYAPDDDEQMVVEEYERTWDQNEDLGLNDINVDNYGSDADVADATAEEGKSNARRPEEEETPEAKRTRLEAEAAAAATAGDAEMQ